MEKLHLSLPSGGYDILIGNCLIDKASQYLNLERKVLVVTDKGVPSDYANSVLKQCKQGSLVCVEEGEISKSFATLQVLLDKMCELKMDRGDCVVAVGGGVVGDLSGFAASCYMRGIDFYNIPTTLLSQVDSSIGGKTAINFNGIKNVIGAFYQPKAVIVDIDLLKTLPKRQILCGLSEAIKMSMTSDEHLFEFFEKSSYQEIIDNFLYVIASCLKIKRHVVQTDEKENGLRKVLNFGHTIGHVIEAQQEKEKLYHGECVALGMKAISNGDVKKRLVSVLQKVGLPTDCVIDKEKVNSFLEHDKKIKNGEVSVVLVEEIGKFRFAKFSVSELAKLTIDEFKGV